MRCRRWRRCGSCIRSGRLGGRLSRGGVSCWWRGGFCGGAGSADAAGGWVVSVVPTKEWKRQAVSGTTSAEIMALRQELRAGAV